jgi:hypothetical protein
LIERDSAEIISVEETWQAFPSFFFDEKLCSVGIRRVENFRKGYNTNLELHNKKSIHDIASHGTKALMYGVKAIASHLRTQGLTKEMILEMRIKALRKR